MTAPDRDAVLNSLQRLGDWSSAMQVARILGEQDVHAVDEVLRSVEQEKVVERTDRFMEIPGDPLDPVEYPVYRLPTDGPTSAR